MKTKFTLLLAAIFGIVAATTSVFGQTTYTWIGAGDGASLTNAANYTTNEPGDIPAITLPNGTGNGSSVGDFIQWDNQIAGPINCTYNNNLPGTGFGTFGLNLVLTANQAANVQIHPAALPSGGMTGNMGLNSIAINSPVATLLLGDTTGNANSLNLVTRPGVTGTIHDFLNDSANPAIIYPNVRWQAGGGDVCVLDFDGTGNWLVTNNLAQANGAGIQIQKDGTGSLFWNGPSTTQAAPNGAINGPITIDTGAIVLEWNDSQLIADTFLNEGYFEFDAPGQSQTLNGSFSGAGTNVVVAGTLTLGSPASTYSGNTILDGGEVIVTAAETLGAQGPLGEGGFITFAGGTLGWSVNNVFDYSPRFDPSANQQYSFDTGGQNVTLTNNLINGGTTTLAKVGSGTLTLAGANTYSGLTTVAAGKLQIQGSASTANITVDDSAALGVFEGGAQIKPALLTVGTSSGATLEFNNVSSTTTPALVAGSITANGPITINVNSGTFNSIGEVFPLFQWTTGSAPPVTLGTVTGAAGTLSTNGNIIELTLSQTPFIWTGIDNSNWDLTTLNNWKQSGASTVYANGITLFDDSAPGTTNVNINAVVQPTSLSINNSVLIYSITNSATAYVGGTGGLSKSGTAMATLTGGNNKYTGVTTISGGILSVGVLANGGSASDIGAAANSAANLVLNGGTLQYTGAGSTSDHLLTLGTSGGTIDDEGSGGLTLNNGGAAAYSGPGARTLTLTGSDITANDTLATVLGDNGGKTALTKLGAGTWIVTGLSANSGVVSVEGGTLQVGNGGNSAIGSGNIVDDFNLDFDTANTTVNGTVSGNGSLTNSGPGTTILPGNNTYLGDTYITAGTLQVGNGGSTGSLSPNGNGGNGSAIVDNGTLVFDSTGTWSLNQNAGITGTGNLIVEGTGGTLAAIGPNTYTGWTLIMPGATFQPCKGDTGSLFSSIVTNNGELLLIRQDTNVFVFTNNIVGSGEVVKGDNNPDPNGVSLLGANTYTGGTFINGGNITLGNDTFIGAGSIVGTVVMSFDVVNQLSSAFVFDRPDNFVFTNTISGNGNVQQQGSGTAILTGNNTYTNGVTTINPGTTLQVGNGAAAGTISVDNVSDSGTLVFDRSDIFTASNLISNGTNGPGSVVQFGAGTLNLSATNFYTGATVVSNGTLIVSGPSSPNGSGLSTPNGASVGGDLDLSGGTLVAGGAGLVFSNDVAGNLNINGGTIVVTLNKSLTQLSNTFYQVAGAINNNSSAGTPATLVLYNYGPLVKAGDTFGIFSQGVPAGAHAVAVSSPSLVGVTWNTSNLSVNGTITALTSQSPVPVAGFARITVSGSTATISATNGAPTGPYSLLETTNLNPPVVWTPVITTGYFDNSGDLTTNIVSPGIKKIFFDLTQP